ncbi:uncharacterized protein KY384_006983 [Bacidia gigantensis]|uniref:uncharacterized protein n=1 Tax=Bacidia gigantensis TaxID=2732470 RepID=UPI001D04295E|nr:uncharacterized protein KY384_006983 [Bacidia gigantensis]KAG8528067.1 hypothetical protein KY384_006983 [Bacidia gigantensis]
MSDSGVPPIPRHPVHAPDHDDIDIDPKMASQPLDLPHGSCTEDKSAPGSERPFNGVSESLTPSVKDQQQAGKRAQEADEKSTSSEDVQTQTPKNVSSSKMNLPREVLFVFIICSSNILTQAGLGMVIDPLNIIGHSFGSPSPGQLSWFVAAYSLTVGTFILIAGRLGDLFGHKLLFVAGFFWYGLWSLVAGFTVYSRSQIFFDVCRSLQGIGPAMMVPNSLALLGRTYPPGRRKEFIFSIYGATAPNGFILGAVFGALLAQLAWWPWEFWIMAIACFTLGLFVVVLVPSPDSEGHVVEDRSFDVWGALSGVAGLVLFNVAWNQAPIVGWSSPHVIVLLVLGLLFFGAFFLIERKVRQPLIPIGALTGKAGFVLGCIAAGWSSFGIFVFYFFQFIQNLRHVTPLEAASQVVPAGPAGICAALTTGYILSRVPTSTVMSISMLAFCIGNILLATMPVGQRYWLNTFICLLIMPWGMDMSFPAATIILSDLVPPGHQGIAASLVVTVVNYSISIGLGIAGTVEVHVNRGGQDLLRGYRGAFYAAIGLSGLGFIFALYSALSELRLTRRSKPASSA